MLQSNIRTILRWFHLTVGLLLLCYIYSPFSQYLAFQIFVKFIAIPLVVLSGLWIWKFAAFNKFFKIGF
ncbi:MAG: hypothetical protein A2787_03275 [Omnitrophica WOR_2 bacterium RIFCSPHIGHO2_01_FULL_48_9]|nr:MAG: hypothetical protein A3D10_01070 [Omnitrophica WOR_2 bacterium RIFCSPHIGHO2_02_FULL_48_11]OGX32038.1 MAG: hypothetical protein A2787_03275 [Omnitrophica WOR_2 bacterium RIFCSPHIGHO2_01_FULL_48_9]